jgi:nitroimidazol reductase NimA-like FMN-containing flavoprotein (pyridoxamine 5'-phosphate oxidase superfamily)
MAKFLKGLDPKNVFYAFTHCDLEKPADDWIEKKIASFEKYSKLEVPKENFILFDNTKTSLMEFVDMLVEGDMEFEEDLDEKVEELDKALEDAQKFVDKLQKMAYLQQLEMMRMELQR